MQRPTIAADLPIACTLDDPAEQRRRGALGAAIFSNAADREELPDGYAFRFPGEPALVDDLLAFVRGEWDCCAFLTYELTLEPGHGSVWLRLRGGEGVKEFVRENFVGSQQGHVLSS